MLQKRRSVLCWIAVIGALVIVTIAGFQWLLPSVSPTMRFIGTRSTGTGRELVFEVTNDSASPWNYVGLVGSGTPFCYVRVDSKKTEGVPAGIGYPGRAYRIDLAPRSSVRWSIPLPADAVRQVQVGMKYYRGSVREFRLLQLFRPNLNRPIRFFDGRQTIMLRCTVDESGLQQHLSK